MASNIIYCYSGSGNCLDIAKTIAKELGDTDIIMVRKKPSVTNALNAKTVGFIFPCHGGGMPVGLSDSISAISIGHKAYTYGIISYSGYIGNGLAKLNKIVPLNYWNSISHHCSCIWLFPHKLMLPMLSVEKAQARSEKMAKAFASDIKNRVVFNGKVPSNPVNGVESALFPKIALKKSKSYSVDGDKCIGCGQCVKVCPSENIEIINNKPVFSNKCIGCLSCAQFCPKSAINVGKVTINRERYHNPNITAEDISKDIIHID